MDIACPMYLHILCLYHTTNGTTVVSVEALLSLRRRAYLTMLMRVLEMHLKRVHFDPPFVCLTPMHLGAYHISVL